jgi:hypothetical protein
VVLRVTVSVGWLDPSQDCWDSNMLRLLLDGELYPHGVKVRHHAGYPNTDAAVVIVVPGRYYAQHTDQINQAIKRFVSVLMVVTSDEEAIFDIGKIDHPAVRFWVQTPRVGRDYGDARLLGVGFPPHFNDLPKDPSVRDIDVFCSAQNTHIRRTKCFEALGFGKKTWHVSTTPGFTKGMDPGDYAALMLRAKVAPAPSGAVSPDSFRAFEALEAHCVPILDAVSPVDGDTDYWERVLPGCPAPVLRDYNDLPGYVVDALKGWPANANRIAAYYMRYKRGLATGLREDLQALGAL